MQSKPALTLHPEEKTKYAVLQPQSAASPTYTREEQCFSSRLNPASPGWYNPTVNGPQTEILGLEHGAACELTQDLFQHKNLSACFLRFTFWTATPHTHTKPKNVLPERGIQIAHFLIHIMWEEVYKKAVNKPHVRQREPLAQAVCSTWKSQGTHGSHSSGAAISCRERKYSEKIKWEPESSKSPARCGDKEQHSRQRDMQASFWIKSWGTECCWDLWCLSGIVRLRRINTEALISCTKNLEFTWVVKLSFGSSSTHSSQDRLSQLWELGLGGLTYRSWRGRKGFKILVSAREKEAVKTTGLGKDPEQDCENYWRKQNFPGSTIWCNSTAEAAALSTREEFGPALCLCTASVLRNSPRKIWKCKAEKNPSLFCSAQHR